ncbi:ATP synthase subunit a 2 [Azospirillaceae bacterium]
MEKVSLDAPVVFYLGPIPVGLEVVTTWVIMAVLVWGSYRLTRNLSLKPNRRQIMVEAVIQFLEGLIRDVMGRDPRPFLPLIGTLFLYIATCNLSPLIPGVKPPTASIETTGALGVIVFFAVHVYGVKAHGLIHYLKEFFQPNPLFLPLNVMGEFTRTFSLMVRLCGNIMSHELVIGIVISLAGLLVPVPFMALSILIGLVQAYIFTILATVFIGGAIGAVEKG